jgi:SAM-dependent methyltransferase
MHDTCYATDESKMFTLIIPRDLEEIFRIKHDDLGSTGWGPRMRQRFNYFSPDEYYEAVVNKLVTANCRWLDVGCGRFIFPNNNKLAQVLANRCSLLVGVDPDSTIEENSVIHSRHKVTIENFRSDQTFDVVTLRMVAEHVAEPDGVMKSLKRLTKPGGKVVIYTINRWSPVPIITWITPFKLHHWIKRFLWRTEKKDTFPVSYRMNARKTLLRLFQRSGFEEQYFGYVDDCRSFSRFRSGLLLELCSWRLLKAMGLFYPENCLLGVYKRR